MANNAENVSIWWRHHDIWVYNSLIIDNKHTFIVIVIIIVNCQILYWYGSGHEGAAVLLPGPPFTNMV